MYIYILIMVLRQDPVPKNDMSGFLYFKGYYNQGKRMKIHQVPEMKRYLKELDENDIVT